jgi:hypothetical protein
MTVAEVINEVRDFHEAFTPDLHPDTMLMRAVNRAEASFFDKVSQIAEGALATDVVFDGAAISTALAGTALTMPAYRSVNPLALLVREEGMFPISFAQDEASAGGTRGLLRLTGRSIYLIQATALQAEMPAAFLADLQEQSIFYGALALRVTYVPTATAAAALSTTLTAPDDAKRFLIGHVLQFMLGRDKQSGMNYAEKANFRQEAQTLQDEVIEFYASRTASETRWYVNPVG